VMAIRLCKFRLSIDLLKSLVHGASHNETCSLYFDCHSCWPVRAWKRRTCVNCDEHGCWHGCSRYSVGKYWKLPSVP